MSILTDYSKRSPVFVGNKNMGLIARGFWASFDGPCDGRSSAYGWAKLEHSRARRAIYRAVRDFVSLPGKVDMKCNY